MALTSSSTLTDALNQYNNNLSWEGNITKAAAALEAVRYILANRPNRISSGVRSIDYPELAAEKVRLEEFVARKSAAVNRVTFTRGRMLT